MNLVDPDATAALTAPSATDPDLPSPVSGRWAAARRHLTNFGLGLLAAEIAVLIRWALPLPPDVLPFLLVVIAVCLVTVSAGLLGGATAMIAGGLTSWFLILNPNGPLTLHPREASALLGYFAVTSVILATSQLYRLSEQERQAAALAHAEREVHHQRLFAREMSHRLKNAMAIVQAMAGQTFHRDMPEVAKFDGRLQALADAHNLLNEHVRQPTASLSEVVETAIRPFRDRSDRFRVAGPPLPVPDQQVVSLTIALHELATNAVKYGALSTDKGWVSIEWNSEQTPSPLVGEGGSRPRESEDGRVRGPDARQSFQLEWKEHDGPPVKSPSTKGFGSRLLARAAMGAKLRFEKDGLRCTIVSGRQA